MPCFHPRAVACSALLVMTAGLTTPGWADEVSDVRAKLDAAKKDFDTEFTKFTKSVRDLLDRREADARKAGNKKLVDQIKDERDEFGRSGSPTSPLPPSLQSQMAVARAKLDKAYTAAMKEFVRKKEDALAAAVEDEQEKFRLICALAFGKRTFLNGLKPFNVKTHNRSFTTDGTWSGRDQKLEFRGTPAPHSIFIHAAPSGVTEASFPLDGKWIAFRTHVGVPKLEENAGNPATPLIFEVVGDGKPLWKSDPVAKTETYQTCEVRVQKVKTLTLKVRCPGNNSWARAVWFEPVLAE